MTLGPGDEDLVRVAALARERAYAPYSKYKVGAAIRTKRGKPEAKTRAGEIMRDMKKKGVDEIIEELMEVFQEHRIIVPDSFVGMSRVLMTIGGLMQIYRVPFNMMPGMSKAS